MPAKTAAKKVTERSSTPKAHNKSITGKYIFDKKLKKVVKISDRIPGLNKSGGNDGFDPSACDPGTCNPGMCGMGGMGGMGGCGGMGGI